MFGRCLGLATKREVANIPLVQQPVVRHKLGLMGKTVEVLQAWAEELVSVHSNLLLSRCYECNTV